MAWSLYNHASIDKYHPRPLGVCDRCGFVYNRDKLYWQYTMVGVQSLNLRVLVCRKCMDKPQEQLRTIIIPPDPVAIMNPRPGEFSGMVISSNPDAFDTIVPSPLVLQSSTDGTTHIGDRSPIVTESSSLLIVTEVMVTPNPDPNYMGTSGNKGRDGGYTRMSSTMVST